MDAEIKPIHRRDAETQSSNPKSKPQSAEGAEATNGPGASALTEAIIGAAIEVHRNLWPGLLESAYEECLSYELSAAGLRFMQQLQLTIPHKRLKLDCGYRLDLVVQDSVIIEIRTVHRLLPIHSAQLLTCLKLSGLKVGLLLNCNEPVLKRGIKRLVNHFREPSTKPVISAPSAPEPEEGAAGSTAHRSAGNSVSLRLGGEEKS
jgi:GxxExxY protein